MRVLSLVLILFLPLAISGSIASPLDSFLQQQNVLRESAVSLARDTVIAYLTTGKAASKPQKLPKLFYSKAAVFVTIAKHGKRRGCKGTFEPATTCLRDDIIRAAIGAATSDKRYRPIRPNELKELSFTVSIVGPLKRVQDPQEYPCRCYGLLLKGASGSGVILPGEAKTSSWRVAEARRQAGMKPGEPCEIFVFETIALHELDKTPKVRRKS